MIIDNIAVQICHLIGFVTQIAQLFLMHSSSFCCFDVLLIVCYCQTSMIVPCCPDPAFDGLVTRTLHFFCYIILLFGRLDVLVCVLVILVEE